MNEDYKSINNYVVLDLEMTGLNPKNDKVIEIAAVKVRNGEIVDTYSTLVNPQVKISERITELTGITNEMVVDGANMDTAMQKLIDFIGDKIIVGHNIQFDYSFMKQWAVNNKIPLELKAYDTLMLARSRLPPKVSKKLENLCNYFNVARVNAHRALDDTIETQIIFEKLLEIIDENKEPLPQPTALKYKAKRQTPATAHQIQRLKEIIAANNIEDQIEWDVLTRSQASRLQDYYRLKYPPEN